MLASNSIPGVPSGSQLSALAAPSTGDPRLMEYEGTRLSVRIFNTVHVLALAGNILTHLGLNPNNTAPSTEMTRQMLQNPTMFAALQSLRQQTMPVSTAPAPSTLSSGQLSFASSASHIPAQTHSVRPLMTSAIPSAVKEEPKSQLSSAIGIASHAKVEKPHQDIR